jgi:hypothetical protein
MKKTLLATVVASLGAATVAPAHADPGVMVGISHNFGGATGITLKVLSTNRRDKLAGAIGVSYFPGLEEQPWGLDTSLGYTLDHGAVTLGYDWLHEQFQLGLGIANTRSKPVPPPPPTPLPPPPPPPVRQPSHVLHQPRQNHRLHRHQHRHRHRHRQSHHLHHRRHLHHHHLHHPVVLCCCKE